MKRSKLLKLCSLVLSICIIFTSIPLSAMAADGDEVEVNQSLLEGEDLGEATANVKTADELQAALEAGLGMICIAADFELDRTFYIWANTMIFATEAHTLTRSATFAGDLFVIGENAEGTLCEGEVTLTLGDSAGTEADLLTIDGNKSGTTVSVVGSALFLTKKATVNVYGDVTFKNHKKVGNEKTSGGYTVSYPVRIGGSVAIVTGGAKMNIYGGNFKDNEVNTVADSTDTATQGGVIYNYGTLSIYGGNFEGNAAYFGGVFFNYRTMNIYKATIVDNTAASLGGAIYMPNSGAAFTYIGDEEVTAEPTVTFRGNSSKNHGGAIYARNLLSIKNAVFDSNSSTTAYGGAIYASTIKLSISGSAFTQNSAVEEGGALYVSGSNSSEDILELTVSDSLFSKNTSKTYGGAVYLASSSRAYFKNTDFLENSANRGGAIYATESTFEIDEATISGNTSSSYGGAINVCENSTAVLNKISASENKGSSGGVIYVATSNLDIYNSEFLNNIATSAGGALNLNASSVSNIYGTKFEGNTSGSNAGAVAIYTNTTDAKLYDCQFIGNTTKNYGGGIHTTTKSKVYLYNITAKNNSAGYGGFMYETAAGTVVTLSGLTVSGNTASTGGPIIWGNTLNADLYIDKSKYVDLDEKGDWNSEYWAEAIKNKLTVIEQTIEIPSYTNYDKAVITPVPPIVTSEVETPAQLERALRAGHPVITIMADFEIDRTFYIGHNVKIKANGNRTLTRKADFASDVFVVGETAKGVLTENEVEFVLGNEEPDEQNTLTIDGNKANVTVEVVGSVLFLTKKAIVNIYDGVTFQNNKKVGNEKTSGKYTVSYPARIGGSVAIVTGSATLNIYGGNFKNNEVNTVSDENNTGIQGGVIYNYSTTNIYGGTFEGNTAYFGGVLFNYRTMNIYSATFKNNTATDIGGVIYMPNSGAAFTYIGEENDVVTPNVVFEGNTAKDVGGAIYAKNKIVVKNATFKGNKTSTEGGAIAATNIRMTIENCLFEENSATTYGGAIYVSGANTADEKELNITSSVFNKNTANRAGAVYVASSAEAYIFKTNFYENTAAYGGVAFADAAKLEINGSEMKGNTATYAGCIEVFTDANVLLNNITATQNEAKYGGVIYSKESTLAVYNSNFEGNIATNTGGAFNLNELTTANIYASKFKGNSATTNGGAMGIYSNLCDIMLHGCEFEGNTAGNFGGAINTSTKSLITMYGITAKNNSAGNGGFLYETPSGTVVKIAGLTVSGNTATVGGPIIWGNTFNAKLYMDTSKYVDLDHTGAYDDAYWAKAIVNKLTVYYDYTAEAPKYLDYGNEPYDQMADAVDVKNADELEAAIKSGAKHIRIVADFEIDRTYYITGEVVIFSTIERTLTRAKDFAGEFFVVGEDENGKNALLLGKGAKLTLGNPYSVKTNLLTIDGNKENMEVNVYGTILFICNGSKVNLQSNVTIMNCQKVANAERVLNGNYRFASPSRIGGPVAIIALGGLDIYGSTIKNNNCNLASSEFAEGEQKSVNGGAIYNEGTMNIYGGTFSGNQGGRGGFCHNQSVLKLLAGTIEGNSSGTAGGAIYIGNVTSARLMMGTAGEGLEKVVFKNNSSGTAGGAIYSPYYMAFNVYGNTEFIGNYAKSVGGAIVSYGQLTVRDTLFSENSAKSSGGAVHVSNTIENYTTRFAVFENCTFDKNSSVSGGALCLSSSDSEYDNGALVTVDGCQFNENSASNGGAIYANRKSELDILNTNFTANTTTGEAGAIYAISDSIINIKDTNIVGSSAEKAGGALSVRSSKVIMDNVTIDQSSSLANGGAIYVSYTSGSENNSSIVTTNCAITNNLSGGYGGAIYATRQAVENEKQILNIKNTLFEGNTANDDGGALHIQSKVDTYFKDVTFKNNTATTGEGGAVSTPGAIIEMDTATFDGNTAKSIGGAFSLQGAATVTLNNITATSNSSDASGGFIYTDGATLKLYNSNIIGNTAKTNGAGICFYSDAVSEVYNTTFEKNVSGGNGGALTVYTGGTQTIVNTATFKENSSTSGGGIYISGSSDLKLYNITANANTATKGGFMYETTTGTVVELNGITLSGNTASEGGNIIWGNSTGAKLNINKANYTDSDHTGAYDAAYWSAAIYNKLTTNEVSGKIPTYTDYVPAKETKPKDPTPGSLVSVEPVFELAVKQTNEGDIDSIYGKFPRLENRSNFMSEGQTVFPNINGETVTVDSFIYQPYAAAGNVNVGQGLMIFQAMQYKKANPNEEVYIDISSYRFSVQSAVNINRNSRYFGYMRNLAGVQYDEYGFVRVAYLLVCASKMGIHVNIVGHVDGYPTTSGEKKLDTYFSSQLNDLCDPTYVSGEKTVGDFMDATKVDWSLSADANRGGTDMMHTKLCAVSHYLDMNGVAHKNAVYTSSANLDGINKKGYNGNWALQTATIISDHEEIYNVSVNYLRLIPKYKGQDEIYELQDLMNRRNTEQAKLISEGRANEIPKDEQVVYIGTENDDVFEMYFTPLGGDILSWDELNNPWCKYLRKMYDSEDYIGFIWNAAEYSEFALLDKMEDMIVEAFHKNKNPNNYAFGMMGTFDRTRMQDLVVGKDIGFCSFNKPYVTGIHNKDMHVSYVENGQRYYVSILNSCNVHGGSMYYQSNQALVIKETTCSEDSVFATITGASAPGGIIKHNYSDEIHAEQPTETQHGYKFKTCNDCGNRLVLDTYHTEGEWHEHSTATLNENGLKYKTCTLCDKVLKVEELQLNDKTVIDVTDNIGAAFSQDKLNMLPTLSATPKTIEAVIQVPETQIKRAGVIVGNYKGNWDEDCISLEIHAYGKVRLYTVNARNANDCIFDTDIRGEKEKHIAVTVDGTTAMLYVDGELKETKNLKTALPETTKDFAVGGDVRSDNAQYFKGQIYSVNIFDDVRTAEEIKVDAVWVPTNTEGLLYSKYFKASDITVGLKGITFTKYAVVPVSKDTVNTPKTYEAIINLPKDYNDRGGVIVGNFNNTADNQFNFEITTGGRVRLYSVASGPRNDCIFDTDIRSNNQRYVAVTIDGQVASLYVDGELRETKTLKYALPETLNGLLVGNDQRPGNGQYFKGTIYAVNVFEGVRTADQIQSDKNGVAQNEAGLVFSKYYTGEEEITEISGENLNSKAFTADVINEIPALNATPKTYEAIINLPQGFADRGGAVISNYSESASNSTSIEIYTQGRVRLYIVNNATKIDCIFNTDIRALGPVHMAVTVDGTVASLYVNGELKESKALALGQPDTTEKFVIGGDWRYKNTQYFKGTIYAVNMFSDVRTAEEIKADMYAVKANEQGLVYSNYYTEENDLSSYNGQTFDATTTAPVGKKLSSTAKTYEAVVQVPKGQTKRAGVIAGNFNGKYVGNQVSFEIYTNGLVRLYFLNNGKPVDCLFTGTDIRSDKARHIAVTVDGTTATLYVDGELKETKTIKLALPESTENYLIGGDNRPNNEQYFKGTIYSVSMFDDVRTAEEIKGDMVSAAGAAGLVYSTAFIKEKADILTEVVTHTEGEVVVDSLPTETTKGIAHISCTDCGKVIKVIEYTNKTASSLVFDATKKDNYITEQKHTIADGEIKNSIKTYEFLIQMQPDYADRGGVMLGNYVNSAQNVINFEIYTDGKPRLYYVVDGTAYTHVFTTDIRSTELTHIAFTVDGKNVSLYVNGEYKESATLSSALPVITNGFNIGGDNRPETTQLFKGKIYAVNLFGDLRTPEEIAKDAVWVATNTEGLVYAKNFSVK